jgi:predicted aspartyl protease
MNPIYAAIELVNIFDEYKNEDGKISANEIRSWKGNILVDPCVKRLTINEEIRDQLGLRKVVMIKVWLVNGNIMEVEKIGGIKIRFGNRFSYTDAFVVSGNAEPLLGCIPLEGMDLVVIPNENKLEYNHKEYDGGLYSLKGYKVIKDKKI